MDKRYDKTYKALEVKAEAAEWKAKYVELENKSKLEKEMRESTIKEVQTRHDALEEVVFEHSRKILGKFFNFCCSIIKSIESPCIA